MSEPTYNPEDLEISCGDGKANRPVAEEQKRI
jgi:hypothetical protein